MSDSATLRCADAKPYLSALADGEVAEPMRSAVAAHAATCERCGPILAQYQAINGLFARLPATTPSPDLLDRVLAARTASEPAQRESMRRRIGTLNVRRLATLLTTPQRQPRPALALPQQRSFWRGTGLPVLVAVLLISFSFALFSHISPNSHSNQTALTATPTPRGDAYQQAQAAVATVVAGRPIRYTPEIPWDLPSGAAFKRANFDPLTGTLDITWTLTGAFAQLHVREAPVALANWSDNYAPLTHSLALTWQLPDKAEWRTGSMVSEPSRLAVVQDDGTYSAAVDLAFPDDVDVSQLSGTTQGQAANILRLASLSMDSKPFTAPTLVSPNTKSGVIHYSVQSGSGSARVVRDAYVDLANERARVTVTDNSGTLLYEDFISGGSDTRYDRQSGIYGHLSGSSALTWKDVELDPLTSGLFMNAYSFLAYGDLWYIGQGTWDGHSADELAYTTAPYRTTIYVDTKTGVVLGAAVDYSDPQNVGAAGVSSVLTPSTCQSYRSVDFLSSVPAGTFTTPSGYLAGTPRAPITCAA